MIQIKTARNLLYAWHSGQWSPIYAAASSGLVLKWRELFAEVSTIDDPDRSQLIDRLEYWETHAPKKLINGDLYSCLPWAKV